MGCLGKAGMTHNNHWRQRKSGQLCLFADQNVDWSVLERFSVASSEVTLVALQDGLSSTRRPSSRAVTVKTIEDFGPTEPEAQRRTMQWLRAWASRPIAGSASLKEVLIYHGVSLWWFLDLWWILGGTWHSTHLHESIRHLEQVLEIFEQEKPGLVVSLCASAEFNRVLKAVCERHGVPVHFTGSSSKERHALRRRFHALAFLGRFLVRAFLYAIESLCIPAAARELSAARLVVHTGDNWGRLWDRETGQTLEGDVYLHDVFRALTQRYNIRFVIELASRNLRIRELGRKQRNPRVFYKPYEAYLSGAALFRTVRGYAATRRVWKQLLRSQELRNSLIYKDVKCWDLVAPRLKALFTTGTFETLLLIETAFEILRTEQPRGVVTDSRMSQFGRALIHCARCREIPSLAVEHSFFTPDNFWDFLTAEDIAAAQRNPALACPLPDRILVYGPRDKELMVQGHFPEHAIEVTGAPRWDDLCFLREVLDREALCARYGLDPKRPIVLLATQGYYPMQEEDELFRATCAAVKQIPGAQLAVKLHPLDGTLGATTKRYIEIAGDLGVHRLVVRGGRNLYELLRIADVLVALGCNTAIEASLMGVPVVLADLFKHELHKSFLEHPALLQARDPEELLLALRGALFDDSTRTQMASDREDFISAYCFRADGRAWQRVVNAIEEQVRERPTTKEPKPEETQPVCISDRLS
jgi:hypothetical protein